MDEIENVSAETDADLGSEPLNKRTRLSSKLKVKLPFVRRPLRTRNTNSAERSSDKSSSGGDDIISSHPPTPEPTEQAVTQTAWNYENYCLYLQDNILPELFHEIKSAVLSKTSPDDSKEDMQRWVIHFLKYCTVADDLMNRWMLETELEPEPRQSSRGRRRRTADRQIVEAGKLLTSNESPPTTVRRSKRLRKSLCIYREQGITHHNLHVNTVSHNDSTNTAETAVYTTSSREDTVGCVSTVTTDAPDSSSTNGEQDTRPISPAREAQDEIDTEATESVTCEPVVQTSTSPALTEDILAIYQNKNYRQPEPQYLQIIYEEPRLKNGELEFFSKAKQHIGFDFGEGSWYRVPLSKINQRKRKALLRGYTAKQSKRQSKLYDELLSQSLAQLDELSINQH